MKGTGFTMTVFQHALNPIICIGMSDGKFIDREREDLKSSTAHMADWFQITKEQAWKECEELINHINDVVTKGDTRSLYMKVPISCAIINKNLKSPEAKDYLIRFLEDQATADGALTGDERQLINMYSKIILHGGESAGIHI
jgi:hypothetical protein